MLLEKLDLSGLESWDVKAAKQARSLLAEYHDLFSLEKNEIMHEGCRACYQAQRS